MNIEMTYEQMQVTMIALSEISSFSLRLSNDELVNLNLVKKKLKEKMESHDKKA